MDNREKVFDILKSYKYWYFDQYVVDEEQFEEISKVVDMLYTRSCKNCKELSTDKYCKDCSKNMRDFLWSIMNGQ